MLESNNLNKVSLDSETQDQGTIIEVILDTIIILVEEFSQIILELSKIEFKDESVKHYIFNLQNEMESVINQINEFKNT